MKFIYSLWTKPELYDTKEKLEIISFLGASVKNLSKISSNIELITDSNGYKKLESVGALSALKGINIRKDLDNISHINEGLWAYPKIYSLSLYDEPVCHIDLDFVFTQKASVENVINSEWDILVQSKEAGYHFNFFYKEAINIFMLCLLDMDKDFIINYPEFLYKESFNFTYNCGLLGFKNMEAKQKYTKKCLNIYSMLNDVKIIKKFYDLHHIICKQTPIINRLNINCLIEQYFLTAFSNFENLYVKEMCPMKEWHTNEEIMEHWYLTNVKNKSEKYTHYAGKDKANFKKDLISNKLNILS